MMTVTISSMPMMLATLAALGRDRDDGRAWVLTVHRAYPCDVDVLGVYQDPADALPEIVDEIRAESRETPSSVVTAAAEAGRVEVETGAVTLRLERHRVQPRGT
jgi:hypothetical protein